MHKKDTIFRTQGKISPFSFNSEVAEVFDDMAGRSIPNYEDLQRFIGELTLSCHKPGRIIYDLGCSTGRTVEEIMMRFENAEKAEPEIVAVDKSPEMLKIAGERYSYKTVSWKCSDAADMDFENASMVFAVYILQFMDVEKREPVIQKIYDALPDGGVFVLSEKVILEEEKMQKIFTDQYHSFKMRNGYSPLEVQQKAEALKNVLVPVSLDDYSGMLKRAGFTDIFIPLKYMNFTCMVAVK